jgi:hypothetical protein
MTTAWFVRFDVVSTSAWCSTATAAMNFTPDCVAAASFVHTSDARVRCYCGSVYDWNRGYEGMVLINAVTGMAVAPALAIHHKIMVHLDPADCPLFR